MFIGRGNSLLQEFSNASPAALIKLMHSYAAPMYGSILWDLFSSDCERLYTSYNLSVRNMLKIYRFTHRYFLEPISEAMHLKTMLLSRYVTFCKSLCESIKLPIRFLASLCIQDQHTVMGRVMSSIAFLCNTDVVSLTARMVKNKLKYSIVNEDDKWRVNLAKELLRIRDDLTNLLGFKAVSYTHLTLPTNREV